MCIKVSREIIKIMHRGYITSGNVTGKTGGLVAKNQRKEDGYGRGAV